MFPSLEHFSSRHIPDTPRPRRCPENHVLARPINAGDALTIPYGGCGSSVAHTGTLHPSGERWSNHPLCRRSGHFVSGKSHARQRRSDSLTNPMDRRWWSPPGACVPGPPHARRWSRVTPGHARPSRLLDRSISRRPLGCHRCTCAGSRCAVAGVLVLRQSKRAASGQTQTSCRGRRGRGGSPAEATSRRRPRAPTG